MGMSDKDVDEGRGEIVQVIALYFEAVERGCLLKECRE